MTDAVQQSVLMWFRLDVRLTDNPALDAAVADGLPIVPVFIGSPEEDLAGAASRWWLHQSLQRLDASLRTKGSRLIVRRGPWAETLLSLAAEMNAQCISWNRVYEPAAMDCEPALEATLQSRGIAVKKFNGSLLFEPGSIRTATGGPFQVFTPFWRALWNARGALREMARGPGTLLAPATWPNSLAVADLELEPKIDWAGGIRAAWTPGEEAARARLRAFVKGPVSHYDRERDRPGHDGTSRLSPHLHFGEVSPLQVWKAVADAPDAESYLRQLAWREFAYHLLVEYPQTLREPFQTQFRKFPWRSNARRLKAWQQGRTGYPLVDAGMRELWTTGWMHNRVRMVVASFLVKHLLIPWQEGAAWFLDTLVDADLANNTMGWQWVAGCGVDAAPYFRVFNPVVQGEKFDPDGEYVRRWVPELRGLDSRWIHHPWDAPPLVLGAAGITLGKTYPLPLVDHAEARAAALAAFEEMKDAGRKR
ncbi:MAG: deoxyribodipyrimidine photo-lyase [Acidobacteriaceae bacterium]